MPRKRTVVAPVKPAAPHVLIRPSTSFFSRPPVILAVLISMVVCAAYLWITGETPVSPRQINGETVKQPPNTIERVSQLIMTNSGEQPVVFTVADPQAFLATLPMGTQVESGDKVVIWSDKTVVYSPSKDKLVAVYPTEPPSPSAVTDGPAVSATTIEIRNGSGVNGAAARLRQQFTSAGLTVSGVADASVRREGTIVVDLSDGKAGGALEKVLELSGGATSSMPLGEASSNSSILVIIGR